MEIDPLHEQLPQENNIITMRSKCNSEEARWLYLEHLYEKFQRPNYYQIGGTAPNKGVARESKEIRFTFMTEEHNACGVYLLHLLVLTYEPKCIYVSQDPQIVVVNDTAKLTNWLKKHTYDEKLLGKTQFMITYAFSREDIHLLQDKKFYIPVLIQEEKDPVVELSEKIQMNFAFGTLLNNPLCSDGIAVAADGTKLFIHKSILAAQSNVFLTMFKWRNPKLFQENLDLHMQDIDKEDLLKFFEFIYTGFVKNLTSSSALVLLKLADKYAVKGLVCLLEKFLITQISSNCALSLLMWADLYNASYLKMELKKFIKHHPSLLVSPEFKNLSETLVTELNEFVTNEPGNASVAT